MGSPVCIRKTLQTPRERDRRLWGIRLWGIRSRQIILELTGRIQRRPKALLLLNILESVLESVR